MWTGLVFAGGRSARMGRDKALVEVAGSTLLDRALRTVREAGGAPLVLGASRAGRDPGGVRFEDETAGGGGRLGPLAALRHGLRVCGTPVAVALACDLPLVPAPFLAFLAAQADRHPAVVPRALGELQVLAAAYTTSCLGAIEARLASGRRSVHGFLEDVEVRVIEGDDLRPFGGEEIFLNVNTPEDRARAESILLARPA